MRRKICWLILFVSLFASPIDVFAAGSTSPSADGNIPAKVWDIPALFYSVYTATGTSFMPVSTTNPLPVNVSGGISISSATINAVQPYVTEAGIASSSKLDSKGSLNVNLASQSGTIGVTVLNAATPPFITQAGVASAAMLDVSGNQKVSIASQVGNIQMTVMNDLGPAGYATSPLFVSVNNMSGPTGFATDPVSVRSAVTSAGVATAPVVNALGALNIQSIRDTVGTPVLYLYSLSTSTPVLLSQMASYTNTSLVIMTIRGYSNHLATTTAATIQNYGFPFNTGDTLSISPKDATFNESFVASSTTQQASVTIQVYTTY